MLIKLYEFQILQHYLSLFGILMPKFFFFGWAMKENLYF